MDIYRFIESRDIREHLKSIDYRLTTPEAAYLVWYCQSASLEEKCAAWEEIIATMPSCSLERRHGFISIPDFHAFLRAYMDVQRRAFERFVQADGCVFQCTFEMSEEVGRPDYEGGIFSTYERCRASALAEIEGEGESGGYTGISITKLQIDPDADSPCEPTCRLTTDGAVRELDTFGLTDIKLGIDDAFEYMWIDLPTPFHAGDIVHSVRNPHAVVVLERLSTWTGERLRDELPDSELGRCSLDGVDRLLEYHRKDGDISDMWAWCYAPSGFVGDSFPNVWCDSDFGATTYLDLELHREPLEAERRLLQPISAYLKRDVDAELLLNSWWAIVKQAECEHALGRLRDAYHPEVLEACGIPMKKNEGGSQS